METLIFFIMGLVVINFMLKASFLPRRGMIVTCCAIALFTAICGDIAAEWSKLQLYDWLHSRDSLLDMSVILNLDVALYIYFCMTYPLDTPINNDAHLGRGARILSTCALWAPGVMIFPALFAIVMITFFVLPGIDFTIISYCAGMAVLTVSILGTTLLRYLFPSADLRLEMLFILNFLIAATDTIATISTH